MLRKNASNGPRRQQRHGTARIGTAKIVTMKEILDHLLGTVKNIRLPHRQPRIQKGRQEKVGNRRAFGKVLRGTVLGNGGMGKGEYG